MIAPCVSSQIESFGWYLAGANTSFQALVPKFLWILLGSLLTLRILANIMAGNFYAPFLWSPSTSIAS